MTIPGQLVEGAEASEDRIDQRIYGWRKEDVPGSRRGRQVLRPDDFALARLIGQLRQVFGSSRPTRP